MNEGRSVASGLTAGLLACALAGCASGGSLIKAVDPGGCPVALRDRVGVSASVAQIAVPVGLRVPSGPARLYAGVGRRVLIAVVVTGPLPPVWLLSNAVTMLTYGGTLVGWARVVDPPFADDTESIQVQGGWLRVAPFLAGDRLHAQTETIDLLVVPGGAPSAGVVLRPGRMWSERGEPVPPARLSIDLTPDLHMTSLHQVDATVQFHFIARHLSGARERWQCSVESNFPLVDHASVLPDLWTLWHLGAKPSALALYSPRVGAFRAVFPDPQTARGFARWMGETRARRAGQYELGLMPANDPTGFQRIPQGKSEAFVVRQLDVAAGGD